ncbi:Nitrilase and fragile histidine triad fusion protein NitFhit, partial [Fragariocoptes setiger]
MVFLPEYVDFIANNRAETIKSEETLDGPLIHRYRELANDLKTWISLGGIHQRSENSDKILNTHVIIDDDGNIKSLYNKTHLFNLEIPNVVRLIESETYDSVDRLIEPVSTPIGKIGLGICYDVRFPEMSIAYAKAGASVITYPSSFTVPTVIYHWETLLRA